MYLQYNVALLQITKQTAYDHAYLLKLSVVRFRRSVSEGVILVRDKRLLGFKFGTTFLRSADEFIYVSERRKKTSEVLLAHLSALVSSNQVLPSLQNKTLLARIFHY